MMATIPSWLLKYSTQIKSSVSSQGVNSRKHWTNTFDSYIHSLSQYKKNCGHWEKNNLCWRNQGDGHTNQALITPAVQILLWWLCTGNINVLNLHPHGSSYQCFVAFAQPAEGRVRACCSKDKFLQQRDFCVCTMGHVAQVLQNENMRLSENESRKMLVVTSKREAVGAGAPWARGCSSPQPGAVRGLQHCAYRLFCISVSLCNLTSEA